jgi:hypothetical protein
MHKLKLPLGPWSTEPDEKSWVDAETGLHCFIKRHPGLGHLCGYVGVPPEHPAYKRDYYKLASLNVHGGVTYAECRGGWPMPDLWWIGFDCAHACDYSPGLYIPGSEYRDIYYVTKQCTQLAAQLKDYVPPMSLRAALRMVLSRAVANRNALTLDEECKLNDALDAVYEHIKDMED